MIVQLIVIKEHSIFLLFRYMIYSGDQIIAEKLASLEHYRLDKPKVADPDTAVTLSMDGTVTNKSTEEGK